jgi:formamidopyrimidine-DNA glycosylase
MPELADVVLYVESLDRLLTGQTIRNVRVRSPIVLRTFDAMIETVIETVIGKTPQRGLAKTLDDLET